MCVWRTKKSVLDEVEAVKTHLNVDDVGALADYLGCNLTFDWDELSCRFTQPVLVQSLRDEYTASDKETCVPAAPGSVLCRPPEGDEGLAAGLQKEYKGKVGLLLHMVAWSRPDIANAVRDISRFGHRCTAKHSKAVRQVIAYVWQTPERGWYLRPARFWSGLESQIRAMQPVWTQGKVSRDT